MIHDIRKMTIAAAMLTGIALASPAWAADNAMQVCGAKYQAAKKANTLGNQTWAKFLAQCRAGLAKPAVATKPAPAAKPAAAVKPAPGQPSAAQKAMYEREKQCGAQWRADSAAKKVPAGMTWPKYWSACNKRMK